MTPFDDEQQLRGLYAPPDDPTAERAVMFPLPWYESFLQEITRRNIEVLTYRDLFEGSDDYDHERGFPDEFKAWKRTRDPNRTTLVIQHDVDNLPSFTDRMLAMEAVYGIRSNVFIFRDRFSLKQANADYPLDHAFLTAAENAGFVIGYHQNALQLAGFDLERAAQRFVDDVTELRQRYRIDFVVPHGGVGSEINGRMMHNHDLPIPTELKGTIRWVYNKHGVKFTTRWSDGGLRKSRDRKRITGSDLIGAFLDRLKPGSRNFCLVHPQRWGFHIAMDENPMLEEQPWYDRICRASTQHGALIATPATEDA